MLCEAQLSPLQHRGCHQQDAAVVQLRYTHVLVLPIGWVGIITVVVRNVLPKGVKIDKRSLILTYSTSNVEVRLVRM